MSQSKVRKIVFVREYFPKRKTRRFSSISKSRSKIRNCKLDLFLDVRKRTAGQNCCRRSERQKKRLRLEKNKNKMTSRAKISSPCPQFRDSKNPATSAACPSCSKRANPKTSRISRWANKNRKKSTNGFWTEANSGNPEFWSFPDLPAAAKPPPWKSSPKKTDSTSSNGRLRSIPQITKVVSRRFPRKQFYDPEFSIVGIWRKINFLFVILIINSLVTISLLNRYEFSLHSDNENFRLVDRLQFDWIF